MMKKFLMYSFILLLVSCSTLGMNGKADDSSESSASGFYAEVKLEGNATTGYTWTAIPDNSGVYVIDDESYTPFTAGNGMVGVGGIYTARLKAVKKGKAHVAFEYARSWEDGYIRRLVYTVNVDDDGRITVEK